MNKGPSMIRRGSGKVGVLDRVGDVLALQESGSVAFDPSPEACLRDEWAEPMPGSSYLWLVIPGADGDCRQQLTRTEVGILISNLATWLATGKLDPGESGLEIDQGKGGDDVGDG